MPLRWPSSFFWYRCGSPHPSIFASTSFPQSLIFESWGNSQPLLCVDLIGIIRNGVHVEQFFKNFKENFRSSLYNSPRAPICEQIQTFISDTIDDWVSTSVLAVWAELEKYVSPIFNILPLTVQPSKLRFCHEEHLHLSQFRSRRHKCSSLTRGFLCTNI